MKASLNDRPSPFPFDFDETGSSLRCIDLAEKDFRAASFLDERLLSRPLNQTDVTTAEAARCAATLNGESDFIFHIGHVGSTLVSRLLGNDPRVFALREPAVLRTLARQRGATADGAVAMDAAWDLRLEITLKLLARVWRPSQRSLVKATSFVSEIAPAMLAASSTAKALLMFVSPQIHIATRLAGPASRAELPTVAAWWLGRLHRRLGGVFWRLEALSEGERAALGWVCEMCALANAAHRFPARVRWVDFEAFLADPAAGLANTLSFLRGDVSDAEVAQMLRGGDLGRYSKAPEFSYDARTRRQIIAEGLREHAAEMRRGIAWISAAANSHQIVADAARSPAAAGRD